MCNCIIFIERIIVYDYSKIEKYMGGNNMKNKSSDAVFKVDNCNRCGDEKKVDKFGLCQECQQEVDYEYATIFRAYDMEH